MSGKPFARGLAELLRAESLDRRMAAAIVAGELGVADAAVLEGLGALLESGIPPLQRHALDAVAALRAHRLLARVVPLLAAKEAEVREGAAAAVTAIGTRALPVLQARLTQAEPSEKRALEDALARLGGKDAFGAVLTGLDTDDVQAATAATLAVRRRVKEADPKERRAYLGQVERFLASARTQKSTAALAASLRILGYLEDPRAVPTLVRYATAEKRPEVVREEALVALRFLRAGAGAAVAAKVLDVAEGKSDSLARTALLTLASLEVPKKLVSRLRKLALSGDADRARLAIDHLARTGTSEAADALGDVLLHANDVARSEAAATAIAGREDAGPSLARALGRAEDAARAALLGRLLRPHASKLDARLVRALREEGIRRATAGRAGFEPFLHVAHDADAAALADALREAAAGLRAKRPEQAASLLGLLSRSDRATPEDLYALASLELRKGARDLHPRSRAQDESLRLLTTLLERGFDVAQAMRKDRSLGLEERYYVGFHFAEREESLGEELLTDVAEKAGRTKLGKAAKAKLKLGASARAS